MITLSESAAERVSRYLEQRGQGVGLRLGVTRTGCNGYAYVIDYADEPGADDVQFESRGVAIFVDAESLPLLEGTEVDFVKDGLNEAFRFRNPRAAGECGCGESFNI